MGFFDVEVKHTCKSNKEALLLEQTFKTLLKQDGYATTKIEGQEFIENYQAPRTLLKYHLSFHQDKNDLIVQGELQQTLILAILIILSILVTYGIGVVIIVGFIYFQKVLATKALTQAIKEVQGTQLA